MNSEAVRTLPRTTTAVRTMPASRTWAAMSASVPRKMTEDLDRDQRTGVQADRCGRDQVAAADGDQVGGARAGADEVDGQRVTLQIVIGPHLDALRRHPQVRPTNGRRKRCLDG